MEIDHEINCLIFHNSLCVLSTVASTYRKKISLSLYITRLLITIKIYLRADTHRKVRLTFEIFRIYICIFLTLLSGVRFQVFEHGLGCQNLKRFTYLLIRQHHDLDD